MKPVISHANIVPSSTKVKGASSYIIPKAHYKFIGKMRSLCLMRTYFINSGKWRPVTLKKTAVLLKALH